MNHLYEEKYNNQGCLMKIVEYNKANDIVVEFQDEYRYKINTIYANFKNGCVKNPYYPSLYSVGILGAKYSARINGKFMREYYTWAHIIERCFNENLKTKQPSYINIKCCDEWLNYEKFYEWLHSQPNFDKWYNGKRWAVDKDILNKGNKVYSPENCCLIPQNVNCLFLKREAQRGDYPIGVRYKDGRFTASCHNPFTNKKEELGSYSTPEKAFNVYKTYKEDLIKKVAEIEYKAGNITDECYQAMMKYEVEIDD